mmetsp:Transcript_64324/g.208714  ORF Transcript_64324/g.208714 Transcript_64324/m.208714 type:complete len:621 (-) Transcript_64324:154-2016(-)
MLRPNMLCVLTARACRMCKSIHSALFIKRLAGQSFFVSDDDDELAPPASPLPPAPEGASEEAEAEAETEAEAAAAAMRVQSAVRKLELETKRVDCTLEEFSSAQEDLERVQAKDVARCGSKKQYVQEEVKRVSAISEAWLENYPRREEAKRRREAYWAAQEALRARRAEEAEVWHEEDAAREPVVMAPPHLRRMHVQELQEHAREYNVPLAQVCNRSRDELALLVHELEVQSAPNFSGPYQKYSLVCRYAVGGECRKASDCWFTHLVLVPPSNQAAADIGGFGAAADEEEETVEEEQGAGGGDAEGAAEEASEGAAKRPLDADAGSSGAGEPSAKVWRGEAAPTAEEAWPGLAVAEDAAAAGSEATDWQQPVPPTPPPPPPRVVPPLYPPATPKPPPLPPPAHLLLSSTPQSESWQEVELKQIVEDLGHLEVASIASARKLCTLQNSIRGVSDMIAKLEVARPGREQKVKDLLGPAFHARTRWDEATAACEATRNVWHSPEEQAEAASKEEMAKLACLLAEQQLSDAKQRSSDLERAVVEHVARKSALEGQVAALEKESKEVNEALEAFGKEASRRSAPLLKGGATPAEVGSPLMAAAATAENAAIAALVRAAASNPTDG